MERLSQETRGGGGQRQSESERLAQFTLGIKIRLRWVNHKYIAKMDKKS